MLKHHLQWYLLLGAVRLTEYDTHLSGNREIVPRRLCQHLKQIFKLFLMWSSDHRGLSKKEAGLFEFPRQGYESIAMKLRRIIYISRQWFNGIAKYQFKLVSVQLKTWVNMSREFKSKFSEKKSIRSPLYKAWVLSGNLHVYKQNEQTKWLQLILWPKCIVSRIIAFAGKCSSLS